MKIKLIAWAFSILIVLGCGAQKDVNQRRNLMIPQKDELPRNTKYKSVKKTTNKKVVKKIKKQSRRV